MKIVTITYIRPSTAVEWFVPSADFQSWLHGLDYVNGKDNWVTTESSDGLTRTTVITFPSDAAHQRYFNEAMSILNREERLIHCVTNNISTDYHIEVIHDENDPVTP